MYIVVIDVVEVNVALEAGRSFVRGRHRCSGRRRSSGEKRSRSVWRQCLALLNATVDHL